MRYDKVANYGKSENGFDDADIALRDGRLSLVCIIGEKAERRIVFEGVIAFRFANEPYAAVCPDGVVDGVLIDRQSEWRKSLSSGRTAEAEYASKTQHFLTFVSNVGLLEVLAHEVIVAE